ncbi:MULTISPECIES: hypothetical protein [unclassified Agrococcus]|uniref:hypothetical protein n=1 Tax=unclassified Agrococcus TaxID=2615065 RepID=UPI003621D203
MSHETEPGMDDEFAARMRRGLSAMAPREVARTRRIRRTAASGVLGVLAVAVVAVLGGQVLGLPGDGSVEAVPTPTPTVVDTPSPVPSSDPAPTASPGPSPGPSPEPDPEPTPPPGFEGVAAGVPVVTDTLDTSGGVGYGDTGAAGDEPYLLHDVYVLCRGAGVVETPRVAVDCAEEAPMTVIAQLNVVTYESWGTRPLVTLSDDFTGTVRVVDSGEIPGGVGTGGVAAAWVTCPAALTIGGSAFSCTWTQGSLIAAEEAAWGIPYSADQLVPPIVLDDPTAPQTIRLVLDPSS